MEESIELGKWLITEMGNIFWGLINFVMLLFAMVYTTFGLGGVLVFAGLFLGVSAIAVKFLFRYVVKAFKFVFGKWKDA